MKIQREIFFFLVMNETERFVLLFQDARNTFLSAVFGQNI